MKARNLTSQAVLAIALPSLLAGCSKTTSMESTAAGLSTPESGFKFAVYGDSRTMMYLPPRAEQKADAVNYMVDMFELVLPEKVAKETVEKAVKLTYDPASGELVQIVMPFMIKSEVTTLTVDDGWVTEASVEDVKLLPGVRRTMFRLQGGDWVVRELVKAVKSSQADFILHTGRLGLVGQTG